MHSYVLPITKPRLIVLLILLRQKNAWNSPFERLNLSSVYSNFVYFLNQRNLF
ncbi:Uncharacterised protein [Legionella pneumophila subsp. pascullei]|uniref:Uncharacterized protein n=1 Tax=Legionella pneumophila subsp. pascullei TaxID=91890 RepID=A0AAX2IWZ5_LEGPN|nr:Uncharacterised protein [Legionella pneumophila subsp. pascullei]VEH07530.1 Uncharacterised protein [Legionella pneumophila subsp. pascullei]